MIDQQQTKLEILLKEYETVKAEQEARIGFRDNLLYAISKEGVYLSFLILPWVSLIMG
ncbi:MAG: hypothetical protein NTY50_19285 [Methylobacter sp.]|nr:hypothetical protein [Methylobacter sp.]